MLAVTISSSVGQPVLGHLADRYPLAWLIPAGVLIAGLGIAAIGIAPGYWAIFACTLLTGLGTGSFHPEAARFAKLVSGERRATAISIFSVGGAVGFALGPALVTPLVLVFGLKGTIFMAVPSVVMALMLAHELPRLALFRPVTDDTDRAARVGVGDRAAFARLTIVAVLRSIVYYGLITFAPLYFVHGLGTSAGAANGALTLMLIAGAGGTVAIGMIADRCGRRATLLGSLGIVTVLTMAFLVSGQFLATVALVGIGAALVGTFGLALLMGQEYLPGNIGLASGLIIGVPDGIGGLSAPILGALADHVGLRTALYAVVPIAMLMVAFATTLPRLGAQIGPSDMAVDAK
jgi:FSR family fosmidomycin resistance protein-like MFS transporter